MLVLRLLLMVLSIICLMDGHAEVLSSTTGIRSGEKSPAIEANEPEVQILDRKKKKPKKIKKKKKGKKPKKPKKPKTPKPEITTTPMATSTLKTTTVTTKTTATKTATTTSTSTTTTSAATSTEAISTETISPSTISSTPTVSGPGGECLTTGGKPCIFPFKDGNKEYNECKDHGGKYYWCATKVHESGKYMNWSYCPKDGSCPLPVIEKPEGCIATNKKPCVFPFKSGKKEYNECADFKGSYFWCATGTNSAGTYTSWAKCPTDGSCPLPGENTSPEMTSTSTTAPDTGTTIATDQMEGKVLDTLESLVLGESRDDSLQMAHMLNKTLDTIIKTLEEEKSKSEQSNVGSLMANGEIRNTSDGRVRGISELGEGRMFDLSTVDSMKSVGRESDDCCTDCGRKDPNTKLVEYWETLDTCYCYQKKINTDGSEKEPHTWESSKFSTKKCEQSDCGYNSNVDPDRLVAEQNSAYLLNTMDDAKYTDVFEVLNWNQGFGNPKINVDLLDEFESKISSGYYMFFLVPASVPCDKTLFDETQQRQFPIHMSTFKNIKTVENDLTSLINTLESKAPHWMNTVFVEASPHICMLMQPAYTFVAMNRVQFYTSIFNFAMESGRNFDKFFPFKQCSTKSLTISAMENIAEEGFEVVTFEESEKSVDEWDGVLSVKLTKPTVSKIKTVVFVETEIGTANEDDFITFKGLVIFEKNQNNAVLFIHINMDNDIENQEYFYLTMKSSSGKTKGNDKIKIYITKFAGSSVEIDENDHRNYNELYRRMTGSVVICGTVYDGQTLAYILTQTYLTTGNGDNGVQIARYHNTNAANAAQHNVVQFKSQPTRMLFYNDLNEKGQTIMTMNKPFPRYLRHSNAVKLSSKDNAQYLPWMQGTITFRGLTNTKDEVFTAQISGCGIRLFRIRHAYYGWHTYMSHDNALGVTGGRCPLIQGFDAALKGFDVNYIEIRHIAHVHPIDIQLPGVQPSKYSIHEPIKGTSQREYVGRGAASVVWVRVNGVYQWCLALQRSIRVFNGRDLGILIKDILNHGGTTRLKISHPKMDTDEQIHVIKPVGNRYGYELFCANNIHSRQVYNLNEVSAVQRQYWDMHARIVEIISPKKETRIYIFDANTVLTSGVSSHIVNYGMKMRDLFLIALPTYK